MREELSGLDYAKTSMFSIDNSAADDSVEIIAIDGGNYEHQSAIIANKIMELGNQGIKLSDIAILARNGNHIPELVRVLKSAGIKCITDKKQSVDKLFEIELLNNMLLATQDLNYELPSVLLMQSFIFGFTPNEIAQIKINSVNKELKAKLANYKNFLNKYNQLCKTMCVVDVLNTFI